jgi:alkylresorcinol/alkylpyrone synthase
MSTIAAVRGVVPEHVYSQHEITAELADVLVPAGAPAVDAVDAVDGRQQRLALMHRLHAAAGVDRRHFVLPLERYRDLGGFGRANDVFLEKGAALAERAISEALDAAGLSAADVDLLMSVSVTGIAAPSLEARLQPRLGLRPDVKRVPVFGLGCVAGAAGIARLHDYLLGHPDGVAVLLSVELCSLTFQVDDASTANLVSTGLFGDGAAAVVVVGRGRVERPGLVDPGSRADRPGADRPGADGSPAPRVVATRSRLYPDTERVMGWDIGGSGFRIVLAATVVDVVEKYLRDDVDAFLAGHGLTVADIGTWVAHPGGPRVIDAVTRALDLPPSALELTRRHLAARGNLSSSSVLHVLEATMQSRPPAPGTPGLLLAMGPGFCAELVLLEW